MCGVDCCKLRPERSRIKWEGQHRDEADPDDGNPRDDNSDSAQRERAWLKVLVVEQADEDGDGVCTTAICNAFSPLQIH